MLGKWITRHKNIILLIACVLLVPSVIGYVSTRVNYDVLSYLPNTRLPPHEGFTTPWVSYRPMKRVITKHDLGGGSDAMLLHMIVAENSIHKLGLFC